MHVAQTGFELKILSLLNAGIIAQSWEAWQGHACFVLDLWRAFFNIVSFNTLFSSRIWGD